jgi:hypothetical protein
MVNLSYVMYVLLEYALFFSGCGQTGTSYFPFV